MKKDCFFCKVSNGKVKEKRIYQNDDFISIFDKSPVNDGHCLIITKKHKESFFDLKEKEIKNLFKILKITKEKIENNYHPDSYNIGINDGKEAGQTIPHLHIHLIPRYKKDVKDPEGGIRNVIPKNGKYVRKLKNNKLVRDKIPKIIKNTNRNPVIHIASKNEYSKRLNDKLKEEVDEFLEDGKTEEIADILEVIDAICELKNIDDEKLKAIKAKKAKNKGKFEKRIVLDDVEKK